MPFLIGDGTIEGEGEVAELALRVPQLLGHPPPQSPHFSKGKLQPQPTGGRFLSLEVAGERNWPFQRLPSLSVLLLSSTDPAPPSYPTELAHQATSYSNS